MQQERLWERGPATAAVRIGVPAGLGIALIEFARAGSVRGAILSGVFFAVVFGAIMALVMRRQWRGAWDLAPEDRVAVVRAVRTGEDVGDARLAGAVIDYAGVVRQAQQRDDRLNWVLVLFACGSVVTAIGFTVVGPVREAMLSWLLAAGFAVGVAWWWPRQRARRTENAWKAERAARRSAGQA